MRRLALLIVGAGLLAGCGSAHQAATTTVTRTRTLRHAAPAPDVRLQAVQVTIVDGDTNTRVRSARVTIGARSARTDVHGVARVPLARRAALVTEASKPGYGTRAVRLSFGTHPQSTIRIFRRSLQWTLYGGDPARSQTQAQIEVHPPFRIVWSRSLDGLIEFPAVVQDGVAYIANAGGTVRALDMRDGTVIWRHDTPHGKMASSPAAWGDQLIVHGMDGHIWVLRRTDGRLLWHYTRLACRVVARRGGRRRHLRRVERRDHRARPADAPVRWRHYDGCKVTSSAALSGSTLYIGDYCGRLLALGVGNGALRWSCSVNGRVYGTPAVSGGRVFVPSSDGGSMSAFSTGGRFLWRRTFGSYVYSSPAVDRGRVFFGAYNGVFYALRASDGATLWAQGTGGPISGAATVVDGVAYAGSFSHRILGVDARTGRVVLSFPHGEYVPVSGSGERLLLHGYSRIYAVVAR